MSLQELQSICVNRNHVRRRSAKAYQVLIARKLERRHAHAFAVNDVIEVPDWLHGGRA